MSPAAAALGRARMQDDSGTLFGRLTSWMGDLSIHNLGSVGHIEDIAVAKDQQGKKLGLRMIQALDYVAEQVGCYKVGAATLVPLQAPCLLRPLLGVEADSTCGW